MTHGDIYIPYMTASGEAKYLFCEACSDGYFDGVGYAMLTSSNHMQDIIKLNTIFAGSPFYYNPNIQKFEAKEGDYLQEAFEDYIEDENLLKQALECLHLFEEGKINEVYQSSFAQLSLEKKIEAGFGMNVEIKTLEEVLDGGKIVFNVKDSIEIVKKFCQKENEDLELGDDSDDEFTLDSTTYLYYDNQWFVGVYLDDTYTYIPAIIGLLNFSDYNSHSEVRGGCFTDPYTYIEQGASEKDFNTMRELFQYNLDNQIDVSNKGWNYVKEYMEKILLEEKIESADKQKAKTMKV